MKKFFLTVLMLAWFSSSSYAQDTTVNLLNNQKLMKSLKKWLSSQTKDKDASFTSFKLVPNATLDKCAVSFALNNLVFANSTPQTLQFIFDEDFPFVDFCEYRLMLRSNINSHQWEFDSGVIISCSIAPHNHQLQSELAFFLQRLSAFVIGFINKQHIIPDR